MKYNLKILIFFILSNNLFCQNRETASALQIKYGVCSYLEDSLGIITSDSVSKCDCVYTAENNFHTFINKDELNSNTLDSDLLDWVDEDDLNLKINYLNDNVTSKFKDKTNSMFVEVDIKRLWIRFNIFRLKWKVKYSLIVTFTLTP